MSCDLRSGNTLISYYLNDILTSIGYTDSAFQSKINVALNCWALINATTAALVVRRFPRRKMYLTCACSILTVYCGWTIAQERFLTTGAIAAGNAVLFFMFAYSPCYNIGYNALTYSKSYILIERLQEIMLMYHSVPCGALPIRGPLARYLRLPILWSRCWLLQHLRQSYRPPERKVEISHHVLRLGRIRNRLHLLLMA